MSRFEALNSENDAAFMFTLTLFIQIFTAGDDIEAPAVLAFGFADGVLNRIEFYVVEGSGPNPVEILVPDVIGLSGFAVGATPGGSLEYKVTLEYAAIPLPASLPLAIGGLAALGALRARRRASGPARAMAARLTRRSRAQRRERYFIRQNA